MNFELRMTWMSRILLTTNNTAQFPHGGHAFIAQYPWALADLINSFSWR